MRNRLSKERLLELGFVETDINIFEYEEYVKLKLEDDNWDEPAFDVFIRGAYITCIDMEHQLIAIFDACHLW